MAAGAEVAHPPNGLAWDLLTPPGRTLSTSRARSACRRAFAHWPTESFSRASRTTSASASSSRPC
eukprot:4331346-Alexandrium_andersonii.AAC.1